MNAEPGFEPSSVCFKGTVLSPAPSSAMSDAYGAAHRTQLCAQALFIMLMAAGEGRDDNPTL